MFSVDDYKTMLINYADVIMMTQPKFTSTIFILQTLIDVKKTLRRARSVLPHSLDDDTIHVIQGIWKHTSGPSVGDFFHSYNYTTMFNSK